MTVILPAYDAAGEAAAIERATGDQVRAALRPYLDHLREINPAGYAALVSQTVTAYGTEWLDAFRDPARFQLIIGGKGPLEGAVARFVRTFPEVQRLPYLTSPEAVAAAFGSADLVVQPGPYETFSLATLEALATGAPVVTADAGGAAELAREFGGETFQTGSPEALAAAILRWADSPPSITAAERATAVAARYGWDAVFSRMLGHYREIVAAQAASLPAKLGP